MSMSHAILQTIHVEDPSIWMSVPILTWPLPTKILEEGILKLTEDTDRLLRFGWGERAACAPRAYQDELFVYLNATCWLDPICEKHLTKYGLD